MTTAAERILALAEDERGDGEFEGPEHEAWRAEMLALVKKELAMAPTPQINALRALIFAVNDYLEHPGCNNPARATAMAKLRWAMKQAERIWEEAVMACFTDMPKPATTDPIHLPDPEEKK